MARQKKASEFQCHVKYKNDLPLPPISSVLLSPTVALPQGQLSQVLRNESTAYTPTSLESGMKHFSLPAELLKFSVYNFVDLDSHNASNKISIDSAADKELLMSIEELEKKFLINENTTVQGNIVSQHTNSNDSATTPSAKFIRPDVTWLRRTEYISSVKNNPNGTATPNLSVDEAKEILNEPVKFEEIVAQVKGTFVNEGIHPHKKNLELVQSFPINVSSMDYVNFLILGDGSQANENSILKISKSQSQSTTPSISLFNPTDNSNTFKSSGDFDIQKSESVKSFVLMLPTTTTKTKTTTKTTTMDATALMAKINSNFSLRKRRAVARGNEKIKNGKVIKIQRT